MFKIEISQVINSILTGFIEKTGKATKFLENQYAELGKQAKEVARTLTYPKVSKWEYEIDTTTGLKVLKSEKDSEALDRLRQIADELLK